MARYLPIILVCVLTGLSWQSAAQQLRDPTRPPSGMTQSTGEGAVSKRSAGLSLQSILIAPDRRSAIIDGQLFGVGQRVSGFRIVSIEEGAVTLKGAQGTRRLELFPEVGKRKSLTARPSVSDPPAPQDSTDPADSDSKREEG